MDKKVLSYILTGILKFCKTFGITLIIGFLVLAVGFKIIKFIVNKLKKSKGFHMLEEGVQTFILSCLGIGLKVLVILTVATILGLPMTSFITMVGAAGVAIGLALQGSLSNIAGGVIILMVKPFAVGHYIETPEASGTVTEIGIFYTKLKTIQGLTAIVPNGDIIAKTITNYSLNKERMVDLTFTASYDCDTDKVKEVLSDVVSKIDNVLDDPKPEIKLTSHKDSGLEYCFRIWCKPEDYRQVFCDAQELVKKAFDENAIEIPYQHMDIRIHNN